MNKCCDNCNLGFIDECPLMYKVPLDKSVFDTSKDYCSKWEEKKDKLGELQACIEKEIPNYQISIRALKIIKQRIEESLVQSFDFKIKKGEFVSYADRAREAFDWILGANNEH